ncbi:MAG: ATP-dependent DNA helicase RecQ [Bacteroidales bacterium]
MKEMKEKQEMKEVLQQYWGYDSFRPMQEEIICSALDGKDTLAILPTGGGKSVCFQVPAMMREGICLVVSPLIALMKDQVRSLNEKGIKALAIYSGMSYREIDIALDNAVYGDYKFLYLSPERLRTDLFKFRVTKMSVSYIVVDEAHCISQWGYDFRPDYLEIAAVRSILRSSWSDRVPVIALTATATTVVANDVMEKLLFEKPNLLRSGFERPNLSYICRKVEDKLGYLLKICNSVSGSGIVYVGKRKTAEDVAAFLISQGVDAQAYHAGMGRDVRSLIQDKWQKGATRVIVSTNAFGMGIDKPDVRFVCNYDLPDSIETYFQEAGRAGRDRKESYSVMLWNESDVARLRQIVKVTYPPLEYIKDVYQRVFNYLDFPYESAKGMSIKFDMEKFAKEYKLHAVTAYYAIKYIDASGYWTLTEELEIPAKVLFIVRRDDLYHIRFRSANVDAFLKVLLRLYTGLFSDYVAIDEQFIANNCGCSVASVKDNLMYLSQIQVIKYIPKIKSPMLNIHYERLTPENLRLPLSEYETRVSRLTERVDAMIDFVQDESECRSVRLLRYFGQDQSEPCGKCDVCMAHRKIGAGGSPQQYLENLLTECGGDRYKAALVLRERCKSKEEFDFLIELLRE